MAINDSTGSIPQELRDTVTAHLTAHAASIAADAAGLLPYGGDDAPDPGSSREVGQVLLQLLALAVRRGEVDARSRLIDTLHRLVLERGLSTNRLYALAYLTERTSLDQLSRADGLGVSSDSWSQVAQITRRASFDVLAGYAARAVRESGGGTGDTALSDRLTTLYSRALIDVVLDNEIERATRVGYSLSLILFNIDGLTAINQEHGYGVGDRILERVGILIKTFFRQQDWVARWGGDSFAVVLTHTDGQDVAALAERVRSTTETRLGFVDHRDDRPVSVTLSGAVLNVEVAAGDRLAPQFFRDEAERTLALAKDRGRNRIERTDSTSATR